MAKFNAVIADTKSFKNSIEAIAALIDEGTFQITKEGIKLRAMDPSQIALVDFMLPAKAFEKYEVKEQVNIGVDFSELSKITKRARAEDKIELSLDQRLQIIFRGQTTRDFNIAIIEASSTPPKEPSIEFTAEVKIQPDVLKEALKDAVLVSNHIALSIGDSLSVKSDGDTGSVDIDFPEGTILSKTVKAPSRSVFSLDHMENILRAAEAPSVVVINLKSDAPVKIEYAIGDGRVIYYLAPRIENV
ncbi:MAG: proliferating cell nuclear antigen (pcna) [Candidatus Altiarchaeota archaeon]